MRFGCRFLTILALGIGPASSALAQGCDDRLRELVAKFPIIGTPSEIYRMSPGSFDASYGYAGYFGTALPVNVSVEQYRAARGLPPPLSNGPGDLEQARKERAQEPDRQTGVSTDHVEPNFLQSQLDRLMTELTEKIGDPEWREADAALISLDLEYFLTPEMREPLGY